MTKGISMNQYVVPESVIHCPRCQSTNWRCWDERSFDCWDAEDNYAGTKVVGYLACNDCGAAWTDISVEPDDGCTCDDD